MARQIYGSTLPSDTYGMLRLKMMGCVVAIVQLTHALENVDCVLSRSDIYYITHVGGILHSSHHRFCSDLFNIFDIAQRLTSGNRWRRNFNAVVVDPIPFNTLRP